MSPCGIGIQLFLRRFGNGFNKRRSKTGRSGNSNFAQFMKISAGIISSLLFINYYILKGMVYALEGSVLGSKDVKLWTVYNELNWMAVHTLSIAIVMLILWKDRDYLATVKSFENFLINRKIRKEINQKKKCHYFITFFFCLFHVISFSTRNQPLKYAIGVKTFKKVLPKGSNIVLLENFLFSSWIVCRKCVPLFAFLWVTQLLNSFYVKILTFKSKYSETSLKRLQQNDLREVTQFLTQLQNSLDKNLSATTLLAIICLCCGCLGNTNLFAMSFHSYYAFNIVANIIIIWLWIKEVSNFNKEIESLVNQIMYLAWSEEHSSSDVIILQKVNALYCRYTLSPTYLSAGSYVNLNNNSFVTILGTILTYGVVLFQFQ